jgi:hypothetical protein
MLREQLPPTGMQGQRAPPKAGGEKKKKKRVRHLEKIRASSSLIGEKRSKRGAAFCRRLPRRLGERALSKVSLAALSILARDRPRDNAGEGSYAKKRDRTLKLSATPEVGENKPGNSSWYRNSLAPHQGDCRNGFSDTSRQGSCVQREG